MDFLILDLADTLSGRYLLGIWWNKARRFHSDVVDNDRWGEIYFRLGKSERQVGSVHSLLWICVLLLVFVARIMEGISLVWPRGKRWKSGVAKSRWKRKENRNHRSFWWDLSVIWTIANDICKDYAMEQKTEVDVIKKRFWKRLSTSVKKLL